MKGGMSKHRKSGKSPKSPKAKHAIKREAEKNEIKAKPSRCKAKTVKELMR